MVPFIVGTIRKGIPPLYGQHVQVGEAVAFTQYHQTETLYDQQSAAAQIKLKF